MLRSNTGSHSVSIVDADTLLLQHQGISSHNTDHHLLLPSGIFSCLQINFLSHLTPQSLSMLCIVKTWMTYKSEVFIINSPPLLTIQYYRHLVFPSRPFIFGYLHCLIHWQVIVVTCLHNYAPAGQYVICILFLIWSKSACISLWFGNW